MKLKLDLVSVFAVSMIISNEILACRLDSEEWVNGCEVGCYGTWDHGRCREFCIATAPPGTVIINHRHHNLSSNNGSASISRVASDQRYEYRRIIEDSYRSLREDAARDNRSDLAARLVEDMRNHLNQAESLYSSHHAVRLEVYASPHGHPIFDKRRGWQYSRVELLVRCVAPTNLEQQLRERYGIR